MKACVFIEIGDDGQVSVGTYSQELPADYKQDVHAVGSVDEALAAAKQLLVEGGDEEQGEAGPDNEQGEQTPQAAEGSFRQGFHKAQPAGPSKGPMGAY